MNRGWPSGRPSRLIPYFSSAALGLGADNGPRPRWLRPLRGSLQTLCWRETDSNLYGAFPVKGCFSVYCRFFVRSGKLPFFIPSPTIRFPERAQWGQGTETLAKLGALPPSGACVWQRLDALARGGTDEIRGELAIEAYLTPQTCIR